MKLYDTKGRLVVVSVKQSDYPLREKSKSKLQGQVGQYLRQKYMFEPVLEEFYIPGSKMSLDFFLPRRMIAYEIDGRAHHEFVPFFHGEKKYSKKFANQVVRDIKKEEWCEKNAIKLIRIVKIEDLNDESPEKNDEENV